MLNYLKNNKLGTLAMVLALVFTFAGLPAQILSIWQTKSVGGVSPLTFFFLGTQSIAWVFYSIQKKDWSLGVPNFFVVIFSAIVLFEWWIFK